MQFGERLDMIRKEQDLSVSALATKCETSETVIRNYIKARRVPNIDMLVRICDALDVTPNYLLQDNFGESDDILEEVKQLSPKQKDFLRNFISILKTFTEG